MKPAIAADVAYSSVEQLVRLRLSLIKSSQTHHVCSFLLLLLLLVHRDATWQVP
jgi:hypothetical protein